MASHSTTPSLQELVAKISTNVAVISDYLEADNRPQLSFDPMQDAELPDAAGFQQLQTARFALMEQTQLLYDLAAGPTESMTWLPIFCMEDLTVLAIILRFHLYEHVPLDGTASFEEIAKAAGLDLGRTTSVIRHAMTKRIFREPKIGHVGHTAASAIYITQPEIRNWHALHLIDLYPAGANVVKALDKYHNSLKANETSINFTYKTDEDPVGYLTSRPDSGARFAGGMGFIGRSGAWDNKHLVDSYPWQELGAGTVVDIGGADGHVSRSLAEKYPQLKFVVQDLEEQGKIFECPAHLRGRMEFMTHDFFTPQPLRADAYILRMILHDWPDDKCVEILRRIVPAMNDGARILLVEAVNQPLGGSLEPLARRISAISLHMTALFNGQERSVEDWERLIKATDSRLKLERIVSPPWSVLSAIEVVFHEKA